MHGKIARIPAGLVGCCGEICNSNLVLLRVLRRDDHMGEASLNINSSLKSVAFATLGLMASTAIALADPVTEWNVRVEQITTPLQLPAPPMPTARAITMMNVAMFEATNAIEQKYEPFGLNLPHEPKGSTLAAAASAAHAVLTSLYPGHKAALDAALAADLAKVSDADAKQKGVALGEAAAKGIIAFRANDGLNQPETYRPITMPGVYVPTVIPVYTTLTKATPWVMKTGADVRPPPPPALNSEVWIKALNETREYGGVNSKVRTPEQTEIGRFWLATGPVTWNPMLRHIVTTRKMGTVEAARLMAIVNMVANDGYQAVFDAKYTYNLWRPLTAIRNADMLDNPAMPRDSSWLPMGGNTPPHPEYPCAHCIASTGVATTIQKLIGDNVELATTSPALPGVTRKWSKASDYGKEVSVSRIYAGFHYRFSNEASEEMARKISEIAVTTKMRPLAK